MSFVSFAEVLSGDCAYVLMMLSSLALFFKILMEILLVYNVMLVSRVQQSDSVIDRWVNRDIDRMFSSIIGYYKILSVFPGATYLIYF